MRFEQKVTQAWALELKASCTRAVIADLQAMDRDLLSGEMLSGDSGLANVWEEICAQVQSEQSIDWPTYEVVIDSLVHAEVESLRREQQLAIWAQTDDGWAWVYDHFTDDEGDDAAPLEVDAIVQLIIDEVIAAASNYESKTLYQFLWRLDEEEEEEEDDGVCPTSEPKWQAAP
jgi:hypothetical protein